MKKKVSIIAISGAVLALGALAIAPGIENNNALVGLDATGETCEHVGNHYSAIAAGDYTPGVNEFYACCKCHEHLVPTITNVSNYSVENATSGTSRTAPSGLNGSANYGISGTTFSGWSHDCGYVAFATPLTIGTGAKLLVTMTVTCSSPLSNLVSVYPLSASGENWGANRVDLAVTVGSSSTISISLDGNPSFVSGTTVPGFFFATPLISYYNTATKTISESASAVSIDAVKVTSGVPTGTWTDATLSDDVKNVIMADSTDTRYAAPTLGTQSTISSYTLGNGTDSTASRTCPSGLNGTAQWGISGNKFGFWANDCGYVSFASPLTVTTGSKLEVNLTVTCDNRLSSKVSIYPITATDWSSNRVDLDVTVGSTTTITIPLTGSTSFISGTTVPGFFVCTPLMTWYDVNSGSAVGGRGSYVTVNSIKLDLNYN